MNNASGSRYHCQERIKNKARPLLGGSRDADPRRFRGYAWVPKSGVMFVNLRLGRRGNALEVQLVPLSRMRL